MSTVKIKRTAKGVTTISGLRDTDLRYLAGAMGALESHYWQMARGLPEESMLESTAGERALAANRERAYAAGRLEWVLTDMTTDSRARERVLQGGTSDPRELWTPISLAPESP